MIVKGAPEYNIPPVSTGIWLKQLIETFARDNRIALIDEGTGETQSYNALLQSSSKLAESLEGRQLRQSDVIAICSDNNIHVYTVIVGALYAGIPITSINPGYLENELVHAISLTEPKIIFCAKSCYLKLIDLKNKHHYKYDIVIINSNDRIMHTTSMMDFIRSHSNVHINEFTPRSVNPRDHIACILFSSGTTGLPKGVMTTHQNINARFCAELDPNITLHFPGLHTICALPLFHAYGLQLGLGSLLLGKTMIILPRFEPEMFLRCIEKYRISHLPSVPTLMRFLARSPLVDKYDLSSVKQITYGSAPAGEVLEKALAKRLNVSVRQGYGLTEVTLGILSNPVGRVKPGSVGVLYPGSSCVIRDPETGKDLGPYQHGELCVKGDLVMKGYYRNPEATRNTFTQDGFLRTGDIAYYDNEEYFFIVDRIKDLIKYKEFQVAPAELEAVIMTHPKIADAAVVGIPDDKVGELPMALVVKQPGSDLTEQEVKNYVAASLSKNKHLHGGVVFVDQIPRNSTNKISRKEVKIMAKTLRSKL